MLHEFLVHNRSELIERCRAKVARRRAPRPTPAELEHGIPIFLDQLAAMLREDPTNSRQRPTPDAKATIGEMQVQSSAALHGNELLRSDFTVEQVVHDYGDLCQSVTELAAVLRVPISVGEFGTLNITLDNAIAAAVSEFAKQRETSRADEGALVANERLGELAHELRNYLNTSILALAAMKAGMVGFGGATAGALDRSLIGMRVLIDSTLASVRLENDTATREPIELPQFILQVQVAAALEAASRGCDLTVLPVEVGLTVDGDRHILAGAIANLLQNAFKFTRKDTHVVLRTYARGNRVFIEVEDECGGLAPGTLEAVFRPFGQNGADRSGLGLGLTISRRGLEAMGGRLYARDMPGQGCVFTIELPRKEAAAATP